MKQFFFAFCKGHVLIGWERKREYYDTKFNFIGHREIVEAG